MTSLLLAQSLPEGALGGAFVVKETKTEVELVLRFDQEEVVAAPTLPEDSSAMVAFRAPLKLGAAVTLFDGKGVVVGVGRPRFVFRFSCENDGGRRAQAEAHVTVKKSVLSRPLVFQPRAAGIAALAVVGKPKSLAALQGAASGIVFLSIDVERDGKVDARLSGWEDEAMNCEQETGKALSVNLEARGELRRLRCCGP